MTAIDALIDDFGLLEDWEDRYRYVIELGKALPPLPETERTEANKVPGCASQVWMVGEAETESPDPRMTFRGDSDAHIVRGLVAILLQIYNGRNASDIVQIDTEGLFARIGLREHLTSQRANGLSSMVNRIRRDASAAMRSRATQS